MEPWLAVGHPTGLGPPGSWDLWPLAGLAFGALLAYRAAGLRFGPGFILVMLAVALALPVVVDAWGLVPAAAACLGTWLLVAKIRRTRPPRDPAPV